MKRELQIAVQAAILAGDKILEIYNDPTSDFGIERKADNSPLTKADKAAHIKIVELLEPLQIPILSEEGRAIPYEERATWNKLWIVDPLDGTKEFIKRNGEFTVNIALVEDGDPVLGVIYIPVTRELYFADRELGTFKVNVKSGTTQELEQSAIKLPLKREHDSYRVVASRSHLSQETSDFIEQLRKTHPNIELVSKGSSLKICLIAEGAADVYPRYAPTMEWDTAAGDAILRATGKSLLRADNGEELKYNKEELLNPHFITAYV
ncbi:MAG: 3'(2'),5'-bisphosphate nucleotidase CysQ [Rikenellaceae bacterium]